MKGAISTMKIIPTLMTLTALALTAASCSKLDVVGNDSVRAFKDLLQTASHLITDDPEDKAYSDYWSLTAPDKSARFIWSKDFSKTPKHDVAIIFDAAPFIAAGLDPSKLPDDFTHRQGNTIYEHIVKLARDAVGYHGALDHYGITLGGGNLFEWAKDLKTNDKDIVFVLDPEPFLKAGTDPNKIDGWVFAKVTVDDENGRPVQVDKILKPFNL